MAKRKYEPHQSEFGVTVNPQVRKETDSLRGDVPRSKWIERALVMYNGHVKNNNVTLLQSAPPGDQPRKHSAVEGSFTSADNTLESAIDLGG